MSYLIRLCRKFGIQPKSDKNPWAQREMSKHPIACKIRAYAGNSNAAVLDNKVYRVPDNDNEAGGCTDDLGLVNYIDKKATVAAFPSTLTPDIPANTIVALSHRNFFARHDIWRVAIANLTCENWRNAPPPNSVFYYYDNPILKNKFPAGGNGILELKSYGGAVVCVNGNHRLTGGMAYLTSKYGNGAEFQKVHLKPQYLFKGLVPILRDALENGDTVHSKKHISLKHGSGKASVSIVKVVSPNGLEERYITYLDGSVEKVAESIIRRFCMRYLRRVLWKVMLGGAGWKELPKEVLKTMLDDLWFTAQFNGSKYKLVP